MYRVYSFIQYIIRCIQFNVVYRNIRSAISMGKAGPLNMIFKYTADHYTVFKRGTVYQSVCLNL